MMSCEVVDGKQNLLIGTYLSSDTLEDLPDLVAALTHSQKIIVLG